MTIEEQFVAALLPTLPTNIVEAMREDVKHDRMAFAKDVNELGPKNQVERLWPWACAARAAGTEFVILFNSGGYPSRQGLWPSTADLFSAATEAVGLGKDYGDALNNRSFSAKRLLRAFKVALTTEVQ